MFKVVHNYTADSQTDIHLKIGDVITKVEDIGDGWSLGFNATSGKTGTFPTTSILKKETVKNKVKRLSMTRQKDDKIPLSPIKKRSDKDHHQVPKEKAKIPADILQRRLTHVPGNKNLIGIKLPEGVKKPVKKIQRGIVFTRCRENRILKGFFSLCSGLIACGILFLLLRYSYDYSFQTSGWITLGFSVPIILGMMLSTHIQCIMLLMVPSLFTGKGRAVFMSVIFVKLLSGPVVNIVYNAQQASESMACAQELVYNQSELLKKQLEEPIRRVEMIIKNGLIRLKKIADDIKSGIQPVLDAIDTFTNGLDSAKNALKSAAEKCSGGIKTAQRDCENGINKAKTDCEDALRSIDPTDDIINFGKDVGRTIGDGFRRVFGKKRKRRAMTEEERKAIELAKKLVTAATKSRSLKVKERSDGVKVIKHEGSNGSSEVTSRTTNNKADTGNSTGGQTMKTWMPLLKSNGHLARYKRLSVLDKICIVLDISGVCKVVQIGQVVCQPLKFISTVIQSASQGVKDAVNSIVSFFYFDFDGDINASGNVNSSKTAAQIVSEVTADILSKIAGLNSVTNILGNLLTLSLLFLFTKSIFYLKKFLSKDRFDNFYITKSFKEYDLERSAKGETTVLPLKRKEMQKYVDTRSLWLSKDELEHSRQGFSKVGMHLLIATVIIFFDYVLYFVLSLIDRYGNLNINIGGNTYLDVSVDGSGFLAAFLRAFLSTVELDTDFGVEFNLTTCIPNPSKPEDKNIYIFTFLYLFAFVFIIMQAYGLRFRHKIATVFYPERDEERNKYLHEKIRHKRKSFLGWMRQHIISRNKQMAVKNRMTFRGWLHYNYPTYARFCCCCLPENKKCISCDLEHDGTIRFHKCPLCSSNYCEECFKQEMKSKCLVCDSRSKLTK